MKFSYFDGFYENIAQKCEVEDWVEFVTIMRAMSNVEGYKPAMGEFKKKQPLISPAIYGDDIHRSNDAVIGWDMIMLDIDDGIDSLELIKQHFKAFNYIIYSTANCTKEKLKIRVCVPLDKLAPKDKLHGIWWALNEWCSGILDAQTKDRSRMHYIPARYTNKGDAYTHTFDVNVGIDLDWNALITRYKAPLEKDKFKVSNPLRDLKRKVYLGAKSKPSTNISDRNNPFVYQNMIDSYRLTPVGSHHSSIYKFMVQCCYNAKKIDYPISVDELADMAKQVDDIDGGYYDEKKLLGNAVDALNYTCI
jgi:hypothetical protein